MTKFSNCLFSNFQFVLMEISNLIPHIEALIFASDKPLTSIELTELINNAFGFMEDKITTDQIDTSLEGIVEKYRSEFYPFEVRQSGGGWQFLTKKDFHKTVAQLNGEKFLKRLSAAALETLAIIAYKQPITKGEIETIRGVSTDYTIQKLLEKELIIISGRNEQMPGHPLVYATSKTFMDYFGINSADDLPKIKEVLADQLIEPTIINHTDLEQSSSMAVSDDGELIDQDTPEVSDSAAHTASEPAPSSEEASKPSEPANEEEDFSDEQKIDEARPDKETDENEAPNSEENDSEAEEISEWQEEINEDENIDEANQTGEDEISDRKRDKENDAEETDTDMEGV